MRNFIDFVSDAANDDALSGEFQSKALSMNSSELSRWFTNRGYQVDIAECERLQENKNYMKSTSIGYY